MQYVDLYARKSKILAKGDRLREVSTDEQLRQGRAWAARNGYAVRREWVELGSAYADRERPKFRAAVQAVLSGEVPALWCYMLDRFTRRGARDVLDIVDAQARVVFDYDRLDSSDDRDRERIIVEAERARAYSHRLSARVRDVKVSQRDRGEVLGAVPWGIAVDPRTRKAYPDESPAGGTCFLSRAAMMREIFRWVAAGVPVRQVARDLNDMGVAAPGGGHWYASAIRRAMTYPVYAGLQHARGDYRTPHRDASGTTVNVGTGLVTAEQQRAALSAMAGAAKTTDRKLGGKARHLLTGLVVCGGCSGPMVCAGFGYVCASRHVDRPCPAPATASKAAVEEYVATVWRHALGACEPYDDLALAVAHRWAALNAPEQTAEHLAAQEAVRAAETVRERLQRAFRAGAYDGAETLFADEMRDATAAVNEAKAALAEHGAPVPDASFIDDPATVDEAWNAADLPTRRDLLRLAIDRVTVRKADYRGQRFNGAQRVTFTWAATPESE